MKYAYIRDMKFRAEKYKFQKEVKFFFFYGLFTDSIFWFTFFDGYGIHAKNIKKHRLPFSERNGYKKYFKIGNWTFRILKP